MSAQIHDFRRIPLAAITLSQTPAQRERRAAFDKDALQELAASIKSAGVIEPILLRPFRDEHVKGEAFEIVAGERRFMASKIAGLEDIPANIRELNDDKPDAMLRVAKHLKVNLDPIRKALAEELKAKRKAKRGKKS